MATGCAERRREGFEKGEWEGKRSQEALLRESSGPMDRVEELGYLQRWRSRPMLGMERKV